MADRQQRLPSPHTAAGGPAHAALCLLPAAAVRAPRVPRHNMHAVGTLHKQTAGCRKKPELNATEDALGRTMVKGGCAQLRHIHVNAFMVQVRPACCAALARGQIWQLAQHLGQDACQ